MHLPGYRSRAYSKLHPASAGVHSRRFFIDFVDRAFVVQLVGSSEINVSVAGVFTAYRITSMGQILFVTWLATATT